MESLSTAKRLLAQEDIANAIARGLTIIEACNIADVARQTFYNWLDTDEGFRRHIAYAEEVTASEYEAEFIRCANKASEDPRYQRALIYYLERRERRRERQADREHRAELLRMKHEHQIHMLRLAQEPNPAPPQAPGMDKQAPLLSKEGPGVVGAPSDPSPPKTPTPTPPQTPTPPRSIYRADSNVPLHLRPFRELYHAAPGPVKRPEPPLPALTGDGHASPPPALTLQNVHSVTIPTPKGRARIRERASSETSLH